MECTQRLDFECSQVERICPEQIGFLGILGTKYPVKQGPNKIGRDPHTCNIVLNKNSISRQHAVINILNGNKYMLMDLDSANKTRLNNKSLQAYVPVPLTNGDTVQFGEVFGIFRLLEEETDLPCTQAVDIPDTPVSNKHTQASRVRQATVPESPDISDKDDSFIVPSQPISTSQFKSPSNKFIKSSARTVTAPSIGSKKIDNIFWSSSKKSNSFNLDTSNASLDESGHNGDICETEMQARTSKSTDSIYTAETQLPTHNTSPPIQSLNTQLPTVTAISNQHEVELDLDTANKENENNIYNAETQCVTVGKELFEANTQLPEDAPISPNSGNNIFEANTQFPFNKLPENNNSGNLFEANTQIPFDKPSSEENKQIFEADTQLPFEKSFNSNSDDIFEAKTQLPFELAEKIATDKIFEANTQLSSIETTEDNLITEKDSPSTSNNDKSINIQFEKRNSDICKELNNETSNQKQLDLNKLDDVNLFNDMDTQDFLEDFQSQPILGPEPANQDVFLNQDKEEEIPLSQSDTISDEDMLVIKPTKRNSRIESGESSEDTDSLSKVKPTKRNICIESDESTDCEDINLLPKQKIPAKTLNEDDLTDCEAYFNDNKPVDAPCFEDMLTQVIPEVNVATNIEDMPTQVIPEDIVATNIEDMPTQVIPEDNVATNIEDIIPGDIHHKTDEPEDSQYSEEIISPFKVPLQTPVRARRKDAVKPSETTLVKPNPNIFNSNTINNDGDERYYAATQEILEDLCSQKDTIGLKTVNNNTDFDQVTDDKVVNCSIEDNVVSEKNPRISNEVPVRKYVRDRSTESSDGEDKANKLISSLSAQQICDVIGVDIAKPRKVPSDPSDVEVTPKKLRPFKFMQTELPDSQEIKTSVSLSSRTIATESSSESETEKESQEQTPIVFRKKTRGKRSNVKKDLSTKFDVQALPTRIITRTRKPTVKALESEITTRKRTNNILKPKYLTEQDDEVDTDIISENITRLRSKNDKKNITKVEDKSESGTNKIENLTSTAIKRISNNSQKTDDVIDLTHVDITLPDTSKLDKKNLKTDESVKEKTVKTRSSKENKSETVDQKQSETGKLDDKSIRPNESKKDKSGETRNSQENKSESVDQIQSETGKSDGKIVKSDESVKEKSSEIRRSKENKSESVEAKTKTTRKSDDNDSNTSKLKPRETRRKKETQEKITNYTISNLSKEDVSNVSSMSKVEESLNSTADTKKSVRSTRNTKANYSEENKTVIPEQDTTKRKRGRPRKDNGDKSQQKKVDKGDKNRDDENRKKDESNKEPEEQRTRRSTRQKTVKEQPNSQLQNTRTHEQSTVYNISSESGTDSPKASKRSANLDVDVPSPKRTRSVVNVSPGVTSGVTSSLNSSEVSSNSSSLRSTPSHQLKPYHVLFTAFPCEEVKEKLEQLGAVVVSDVLSCAVVLTLSLRRTFKLLCAVGLGRPIVGPQWVQACVDNNTIVDPWHHLLKDEANETRFKFNLARTLAGPRNYLKGYTVSTTPKVVPSAAEMKMIVECSGGVWRDLEGVMRAEGGASGGRWAVVTCGGDRPLWGSLRRRGATLVTTEFILSGVLQQKLDVDAHLIK